MIVHSKITKLLEDAKIRWQGKVPTDEDVKNALHEATKVALVAEPISAQYQRGGIIVKKETSEIFDVYVYVGSINR